MSTAGPSFKVAIPAVRAAIKAGVHYCDLTEDGSTTAKVFGFDAAAKAAGVTVLMGIGETPGLSNLLMMHAAHQLDRVQELRFCFLFPIVVWGDPKAVLAEWRKSGRADASWQQVMRGLAGKIRLYRDGRWLDVDPLEDAVRVRLPQGGEVTAHPYGSAEPITLPRALPGVGSISVVWSLFPPQLNELWCELGRRIARGELDESSAAFSFYERVAAEADRWLTPPKGIQLTMLNTEWAEAEGTKQSRRVRYKCWHSGDWHLTQGPLAAGALKILRGEISTRGVLSPESCLDPMSFLAEAARCANYKPPDGKLLRESFEELE